MLNEKKHPVIEIESLKQVINKQHVLEDINLTIYKGEIFGIVGGSGSGKTTLLRNILMLSKPTAGTIKVFGINLYRSNSDLIASVQRRWGVLFQHSALFSSLTVLENVLFPLRTHTDYSPQLQREIALLKISLTGLPMDAVTKYPAELSGGMQKRAALARAIVLDPELLLLDEPTTGLDPKSADLLDDLILNLHQILGLTIVIVTHDLDSLNRITNRVAFLGEGKILAITDIGHLIYERNAEIQDYFSGPRGQRIIAMENENLNNDQGVGSGS